MLFATTSFSFVNAEIGISSFPRQQDGETSPYALSAIDEAIAVINEESLTVWRMSFYPGFPDWQTYIQYFLDNSTADLIVDYYHHDTTTLMSNANWTESINQGLAIATYFSAYQSRLWLEPQNEQLDANLVARSQSFVDAIRGAGYSNNIVSDVFWWTSLPSMAAVDDPLDKFYSGIHVYIYDGEMQMWTLSSAEEFMQDGLDAGVKIMNTEVGADTYGNEYFSSDQVTILNSFLVWSSENDVGNAVWLMYGDYEYPFYQALDLSFPSEPTPSPTPSPTPTHTPTPIPTVTPVPTATPFVSTAQAATNQVFTNIYIALGIVVVSTLIAGCYIIIAAFNSGNGNVKFGVGVVLISIVEVVIGVVIVSAFQGSMGTVAISLLSFSGVT